MEKFDYFVIGGGSGGVRAARLAAQRGLRVGLAEYDLLGGTCVVRGCVPKKLMVYAAQYKANFAESAGFGYELGSINFSWPTLRQRVEDEVMRLSSIYKKNLSQAGVEVFSAYASLVSENVVHLAGIGDIQADKILIAAGGRPLRPKSILGADDCLISDDLFHLNELPKKMTVIGSGYIAVEFAGIFSRLGSDVTLLARRSSILRGFDEGLQKYALHALEHCGVNVMFNAVPVEVKTSAAELSRTVYLEDGRTVSSDEVLLAVGRVPHVQKLGLENAGVALNELGAIAVDEFNQTSVANIYAVGDVTDRVNLTPVAISEAAALDKTLFDKVPTPVDHALIPTAIFTQPALGTVGQSEHDLVKQGADFDCWEISFKPMKHTLSNQNEKFYFKLLCAPNDGIILGLHIAGEEAGELIQCLGVVVKAGLSKSDLDRTMAVHPSASEELVTLKDPSRKFRNGKYC